MKHQLITLTVLLLGVWVGVREASCSSTLSVVNPVNPMSTESFPSGGKGVDSDNSERTGVDSPPVVKNLYMIEDVKVDVTAASSQEARTSAIAEAQRRAFRQLLARLLPESEHSHFYDLGDQDIEFAVQDFEITNEKITKVRYIGTFIIRFNPAAVGKILSRRGQTIQPQVRVSSETLIIPLFEKDQHILLWEETNPWFTAWVQGQEQQGKATKWVIPVGDLADIRDLSAADALAGNHLGMTKMLNRYGLERATIVLLKITAEGPKLELKQFSNEGMIATLGPLPLEGTDLDIALIVQNAFSKARELLPQLAMAAQASLVPQKMALSVDFSGLREWLEIKHMLEQSPSIKELAVTSLNRTHAEVSFQHVGAHHVLESFVGTHGFSLHGGDNGKWRLVRGKMSSATLMPGVDVSASGGSSAAVSGASSSALSGSGVALSSGHQKAEAMTSSSYSSSSSSSFPSMPRSSPYYMPAEVLSPVATSAAQPYAPGLGIEGKP
jgi:hypothetical protein